MTVRNRLHLQSHRKALPPLFDSWKHPPLLHPLGPLRAHLPRHLSGLGHVPSTEEEEEDGLLWLGWGAGGPLKALSEELVMGWRHQTSWERSLYGLWIPVTSSLRHAGLLLLRTARCVNSSMEGASPSQSRRSREQPGENRNTVPGPRMVLLSGQGDFGGLSKGSPPIKPPDVGCNSGSGVGVTFKPATACLQPATDLLSAPLKQAERDSRLLPGLLTVSSTVEVQGCHCD